MRRLATPLLALALALPAAALESPLVVGSGNLMVSIDPALGLATVLNVEQNGTRRLGWKHFLGDLNRIQKSVQIQAGKPYSMLRLGSPTVSPTVEEFVQIFPDKPSKKDAEAGRDAPRKRVREAEDAFWEKAPPYDGKLAAAFNGQYLMLAFPSLHALLFYENASEKLELRGWYNYGPLLFVSTGWKSEPSPAKLAAGLILDEDQKKLLEGQLADKEGQPAAAAPSEVWVTTDGGNFVVVDTANRLIFSVSFPGKKASIMSVRNLSVDLLAPGYQTAPTDQDSLRAFAKEQGPVLKDLGISQFDTAYVKALIAATAAGEVGKASDLQANLINGQLVLAFPTQHKILTYQVTATSLDLKSVRDSLFDSGLATISRMATERAEAREALKAAEKAKRSPEEAQRLLEMALALDPELVTVAEKSSTLKSILGKTAAWEPTLAAGAKAAEEAKAKRAAIEAAAQAERDKKKAKKP